MPLIGTVTGLKALNSSIPLETGHLLAGSWRLGPVSSLDLKDVALRVNSHSHPHWQSVSPDKKMSKTEQRRHSRRYCSSPIQRKGDIGSGGKLKDSEEKKIRNLLRIMRMIKVMMEQTQMLKSFIMLQTE
ncbi:unnamed protein product [Caretta caretta]